MTKDSLFDKLLYALATIALALIFVFILMSFTSCGKEKNYCWQCTNWNGNDIEVCDKSEKQMQTIAARDTLSCHQK